MRKFLQYDDTQVIKYDSLILAVIYTIGHILIAMTCNRIITGATIDMAAVDAFIEPIINAIKNINKRKNTKNSRISFK
mgnify:CR=1 FL=1